MTRTNKAKRNTNKKGKNIKKKHNKNKSKCIAFYWRANSLIEYATSPTQYLCCGFLLFQHLFLLLSPAFRLLKHVPVIVLSSHGWKGLIGVSVFYSSDAAVPSTITLSYYLISLLSLRFIAFFPDTTLYFPYISFVAVLKLV